MMFFYHTEKKWNQDWIQKVETSPKVEADKWDGESKHHVDFISIPMTDPWDWYIYLHEWLIFMGNS